MVTVLPVAADNTRLRRARPEVCDSSIAPAKPTASTPTSTPSKRGIVAVERDRREFGAPTPRSSDMQQGYHRKIPETKPDQSSRTGQSQRRFFAESKLTSRHPISLMEVHMYVVLGASGNTGRVVATNLLGQGQRVRVVGRNAAHLQSLATAGAEVFVGDITDASALSKAFQEADSAYVMIPPNPASNDFRAYQDRTTDAIAAAVQ